MDLLHDDIRKMLSKYGRPFNNIFFHLLSGSRGFQGVVSISTASVDANNTSNILISAFQSPVPEVSFFLQPEAGLTNWHQYRICRAPLAVGKKIYSHMPPKWM